MPSEGWHDEAAAPPLPDRDRGRGDDTDDARSVSSRGSTSRRRNVVMSPLRHREERQSLLVRPQLPISIAAPPPPPPCVQVFSCSRWCALCTALASQR
jgi:hypothetical protein